MPTTYALGTSFLMTAKSQSMFCSRWSRHTYVVCKCWLSKDIQPREQRLAAVSTSLTVTSVYSVQ
jgi:hypothetical protein